MDGRVKPGHDDLRDRSTSGLHRSGDPLLQFLLRRGADLAGRELAVLEQHQATNGSVIASDAFFPFADGLLVAIEAGATAVIQPGGSVRDDEVIKAADDHGIAMVFTGTRHFRH